MSMSSSLSPLGIPEREIYTKTSNTYIAMYSLFDEDTTDRQFKKFGISELLLGPTYGKKTLWVPRNQSRLDLSGALF